MKPRAGTSVDMLKIPSVTGVENAVSVVYPINESRAPVRPADKA